MSVSVPNLSLITLFRGYNTTYYNNFMVAQSIATSVISYFTSLRLTFGANPFPEVTDLFCRLPLPTLIYRLEAAHLGYLLR